MKLISLSIVPKGKILLLYDILLVINFSCTINDFKKTNYSLVNFYSLNKEQFSSGDANLKIIDNNGTKAISIQSKNDNQATLVISSAKDSPWDLANVHQIKSEVTNLAEHKTQVNMYVGLDPDPLMRWYCSDYIDLNPGETKTIKVDLTWLPWVHSPQLDLKYMRGIPGREKTERKAIQQVTFSVRYPTKPNHYTVNMLYATGTTEVRDTTGFFPFVDELGQYKHDDWPGKIQSVAELKEAARNEVKALDFNKKNPETDIYGGWEKGPKQDATGYFYPKEVAGKWWLVDPIGNLFWSAGVNCVSYQSVYTIISERERYFEGIPDKTDKNKDLFSERREKDNPDSAFVMFNHFAHNLQTAYGDNYLETYRDITHKRFKEWGLNTIGFMSDQGLAAQQKTPYVGSIRIRSTKKIEGSSGYQGKFHDVFDMDFETIVKQSIEAQKFGANDPWCIGYFVDNEMSWGDAGSLSLATLASPADQPAKQEFVKDLKIKYREIEKLNDIWKTQYSSWNDILKSTRVPDAKYAREDLDNFYDKLSRKYFKTVRDELKKVAPHQNYLGCRLAWAQNDITLRAAADFCDIISFNKYEFNVEDVDLPVGVDKPIIIGEFHFGSLDRGMFHVGVKAAYNQAERAQKYQEYIQSALRNNYIVGAHWFQYIDESITGRGDGENYNVGIVNVCNIPYPELVGKVKETCYDMYPYRNLNQKSTN